jgi:hypothetical protein
VIEAVQRDALDSMGTLFEQVGDESSGQGGMRAATSGL